MKNRNIYWSQYNDSKLGQESTFNFRCLVRPAIGTIYVISVFPEQNFAHRRYLIYVYTLKYILCFTLKFNRDLKLICI